MKNGVISLDQITKSRRQAERGFTCCGKYYAGNGGANNKKMHLLEEMPEYKGLNYSFEQLRLERMRRLDLQDNRFGGLYATAAALLRRNT